MFPELSKRASPAAWKGPADVLSEAERVIARGPGVGDLALLFLANGSQLPKPPELGIALDCWAELWPRLHRLKSEHTIEAVLQAVECAIDSALASRDAYLRYSSGPTAEELDERTRAVTAQREHAGELYDRGWSRHVAEEGLRREREQRWAAAEGVSIQMREALLATLKAAT